MTRNQQDLAWSCLPREFREEVKRMWSVEGDCAIKYKSELHKHRTDLMYELFGDNLTSDAEGEEMLMVSRKRVQEMFGEAQKAVPTCEHDRGFRNAELTILRNLFGSVCLPDNVDSSEPNVGSSESKPAEPNLKVGDIVRVKGCGYEPNIHKGDIGEILDTNDNEQCFVLFKKSQAWIYFDCLEPYTEPKEEASPNVNHSDLNIDEIVAKGYVPDPSIFFDGTFKDSSRNERRLNIAVQILSALLVSNNKQSRPIKRALELTDAIIVECEKGGTE